MKEHGNKHPAEVPPATVVGGGARTLKSLLKKPGQTKSKGSKNRVVINEKLNEFFAADYIILIKEECCGPNDYEEDCDCCCQEHEMIRLGSCKECRAELNLHFGPDRRGGIEVDIGVDGSGSFDECESAGRVASRRSMGYANTDHRYDEEEDDDENEEEEEDDVDDEAEEDESHIVHEIAMRSEDEMMKKNGPHTILGCHRIDNYEDRESPTRRNPQQQQETLSPPEGYKDVCGEESELNSYSDAECHLQQPITTACSECNYYQQQQQKQHQQQQHEQKSEIEPKEASEMSGTGGENPENRVRIVGDENTQQKNDQARETASVEDLHQRYLVETITMTTVTERRIVREINDEETKPYIDKLHTGNEQKILELSKDEGITSHDKTNSTSSDHEFPTESKKPDDHVEVDVKSIKHAAAEVTTQQINDSSPESRSTPDLAELSLTFNLGSVSSLVTNSLQKPNSAVRQLFPDPRFISPPPAPTSKAVSSEDSTSEAQKFLITTESLRLFDAVKRNKLVTDRSGSSESEPTSSSIRRMIERNTLRRSLIGKYDGISASRKKNLRSKDLSLEERIKRLTCIDQDEEDAESSSASDNTNAVHVDSSDHGTDRFLIRTSPSGEEHPKNEMSPTQILNSSTSTISSAAITVNITRTSSEEQNSMGMNFLAGNSHNHSTYRKLSDLFAQKKTSTIEGVPELNSLSSNNNGRNILGKEYPIKGTPTASLTTKMNSDVRRQFLASLAPLSCVTSNGIEGREDYYRMTSRIDTLNRDSVEYNSDSSYSLEDIESVLNNGEANYGTGPPDVTRGTPTGLASDSNCAMTGSTIDSSAKADEQLLAFVEQDKSRTERIRKRYNEPDERHGVNINGIIADGNHVTPKENDPDEDDELNDYGFNRRPSVRGIKQQFGTTDKIVQQARSRSVLPNDLGDVRANFNASWPPYHDKNEEKVDKSPELTDTETMNVYGVLCGKQNRDTNTINRINTMQKQIDDIYQTIAETTTVTQSSIDGTDVHSAGTATLPRCLIRMPMDAEGTAARYTDQNGQPLHQESPNARMLRIAGGGDETSGTMYMNTLSTKTRRYPIETMSGYHYNTLSPSTGTGVTKCYRTMYFVPYNSISDPTYQNIQRILTPHSSSPNYATHIERYPYPRQGRTADSQQQQRYYPRSLASTTSNFSPIPPATSVAPIPPQTLHLHLHHHEPEDFRISGSVPMHSMHSLPFRHHHQLLPPCHMQTLPPSYSVIGPTRCGTTSIQSNDAGVGQTTNGNSYQLYQVHLARTATDVQTQTISSALTSNVSCVPLHPTNFNGINQQSMCDVSSSYASSSPALASPTKLHPQQRQQPPQMTMDTCDVAERGVPEGAASAPAQDFSQTGIPTTTTPTSQIAISSSMTFVAGHQINGVSTTPNNTVHNSVYYAMNV